MSDITGVSANMGTDTSLVGEELQSLGKEDFMKLLVTQLQYQDPLKPMDNTEFIAQLAQFSTLEGINNMYDQLGTMTNYIQSMNNYNASDLIGKDVKAYGDTLYNDGSGTTDINYILSGGAAKVVVSIMDESGSVVRTIEESNVAAGSNTLIWDGKDTDGNDLPSGQYTFNVSAQDANGGSISADTVFQGTVKGVVYEDSIPYLMVGDSKIAIGDVLEILDGSG